MPVRTSSDEGVGLPSTVEIGARFISEDSFGTLRYVGEVPPTKGIWLGVEWDNPERGKHDGSNNGVQYFKVSSPTGGSFIRPKKADFGVDFLSALRDRYVPDNAHTADIDEKELFIRGANNQITMVEMVGAVKVAKEQSTFASLRDVVLRDMRINQVGTTQLEQETPGIKELYLSKNLLPSWQAVSELTGQLKQLKRLSLSENRLQIPPTPSSLASCFSRLQELSINYMNLTWAMVAECAPMWPSLQKLHVCFNQISSIDRLAPGTFETLQLLNLEGNQISEWQHIMCLSHLPRLDTLILNSNSLTSLMFEDTPASDKTQHFASLRSLSVSDNLLSSWRDIAELEKLASLTELKVRRNPFMKDILPVDVRSLLIARLGGLKTCNGSIIMATERKGSEIEYINKTCKEWLASGGSRDSEKSDPSLEFLQLHPRYQQLIKKYGIPEESELVVKTHTLKDGLIAVTIRCPDDPNKRVLTKKLPGTMELQKLKSLIHKLLKVDVSDQRLTYTSQKVPGQEMELDNDMRELSYFAIESGDTILVRW
ncbi:tubulin-specific chaperone E-like [Patiria miniata]|uniref:Tubulin-specific chaperone E n=1 Tax=Patiria miniata TaxID=46514 RepID=A0A914APV1_PATMI|nr:tubulin-specific chaperone E-like [Patiria miniata]